MRIGLVGNGGREHAIAMALLPPENTRDIVYVFASYLNPGLEGLAAGQRTGNLSDVSAITAYFQEMGVELAIIGPEAPLVSGVVDSLRKAGTLAFGPTRAQVRLESDKFFMRSLLKNRLHISSPAWCVVRNREDARKFILDVGQVAVKPVGFSSRRGVQVMGVQLASVREALAYANEWLRRDGVVLLEERLVGEEFARMIFTDGRRIAPMPVTQDFRNAFDSDYGPMTGGMGAFTQADGSMTFLQPEELAEADRLNALVLEAIAEESGAPFRGVLCGQFMVTARGVRVVEFDMRFGDPEAINVLALLQGDLSEIFHAAAAGQLDPAQVRFRPAASVVKYLVPETYPYVGAADEICFDFDEQAASAAGFDTIYASISRKDGRLAAHGSRALALVGTGADAGEVSARMENLLKTIEPEGLRHRGDIGAADVTARRAARMAALRAGREE
jgi:phosphoribosylamine---glycine ligase